MPALILLLLLGQDAPVPLPQPPPGPAATTREGERRFLDPKKVPAEGPSSTSFMAPGWKIESFSYGDLNGDAREDVVLRLVENLPFENEEGAWNDRHRALVIIFKRADGSFERAAVATRLIYCSTCAGALGDQEGANISVEIKGGVLNVSQMSGSRWATDHTWRFRYDAKAGRFALIGEDVETSDRAAGGGTSTSTNYLTGLRVTKKTAVLKEGQEPRVVSTRRTRLKPSRRFIEDVDYEEQ